MTTVITKRTVILTLVMLTAVVAGLGAADRDDFDAVVDMEISLTALAQTVAEDPSFRTDDILLLTGAVGSIIIIDSAPDTFFAQIELVAGAWMSLDALQAYRGYFVVEGPEFASRLPSRPPRNPGPEIIQTNQNVLVVASLLDVVADTDGTPVPVLRAHYVVRID